MSEQSRVEQFETLLDELRAQVQRLEDDGLSLGDAVAAYERAVALANECQQLLDEAELRVQTIDASARVARESAAEYRLSDYSAARLLLGDDDDDLLDLMTDE